MEPHRNIGSHIEFYMCIPLVDYVSMWFKKAVGLFILIVTKN